MKLQPRWILGTFTCALLLGACRNQPDATVGSASLPLQAAAPSGNVYQLRNASFRLVGPASTVMLSTAGMADTAASLLAPNLPVGPYTAELLPGWTLVRVVSGSAVQSVQAVLRSANPTSFAVANMADTTVGFAFEAQGDVVDTSTGGARVVITVTESDGGTADGGTPPADGGMCSPPGGPCNRAGGTCCPGVAFCPLGTDTCEACRQLTQTCSAHGDCCGNSCVNGRCTDGSCSQAGGPCGRTGGTCCSGTFCPAIGDVCQACRQLQQSCTAHGDCCSGSCVNGQCTDGSCSAAGGPCGRTGGTCCSGTFCPAIGDVCQACRQLQQSCTAHGDCCSGSCVNGQCTDGSCSAAGGPCGRTGGTCCSGAFCPAIGDVCQACRALQQTCANNGECCSNSCVGGRCTDGSCQPAGGFCGKAGGTCCAGVAFCPQFSDMCAACRQTQQTCSADGDCCSGNACVAGRCALTTLTAPTFLGAGAGVAGTGDLSVAYPAGVGAGQLLMLQLGSRSSNVPTTPAGWTLLWFDERPNARQRIYWKLATAADTGTLAVTMGTSNVNVGRMYSFGGVTSAPTFLESAVVTGADTGTLPGPTVACAGTGRLAVDFIALDSNPLLEPMVGETGGDWIEAVPEFPSDIGSNFGIQAQIAPMPTGGTISGGTANLGGGSDSCLGRAFALIGR